MLVRTGATLVEELEKQGMRRDKARALLHKQAVWPLQTVCALVNVIEKYLG